MKRYLIGFTLILLVMSSYIGCGNSDDKVIAEVGDYEITTSEFDAFLARFRLTFATAQDEYNKRLELLDTMIVTRMLIQAGYERGIDKMDEIDRIILANKDRFLLDALYQSLVSEKSIPSDAELQDFYNHLEFKYRASHVLVADLDTAKMLFNKIQEGENFEQLAFDYSIDPQAKRNKGDLGYFVWGSMINEFQEAVYQMEPGELSPPVKSKYGYHIIKLVDKLPNENRTSFEQLKPEITAKVRQSKTTEILDKFFVDLKEKFTITIDSSTCQYLMHKRESMYPPQVLMTLPKNDFDINQLDRNEKELIIATVKDGGQFTVNDYLTQLKNVPVQMRPNIDDYDSLATIIFEMKKMDILALEAVQLGFDNEENYLSQIKLFKELNMAAIMRNDSILPEITPDEAMIRQYYDDNPEEFTNPAQIHVYEILLSDEIKARKLASQLKSLKAFKERAMDLTERPGKRTDSGDLGYITRKLYPEIFDLAKKTNIGKIAGPVVSQRKYSIFYVVDKIEPELKDFLGQKRIIQQKLLQEQKEITFNKWVENRRNITNIEIDEDALWASINMDLYANADSLNQ